MLICISARSGTFSSRKRHATVDMLFSGVNVIHTSQKVRLVRVMPSKYTSSGVCSSNHIQSTGSACHFSPPCSKDLSETELRTPEQWRTYTVSTSSGTPRAQVMASNARARNRAGASFGFRITAKQETLHTADALTLPFQNRPNRDEH